MDIIMGSNDNDGLNNSHTDSKKDISINIYNKKNKKREIIINSFIKKFPKVKLHTIIKISKYYTDNYDQYDNELKILNNNKIINEYLTELK
jgi:hypothetical protein